MHKDYDSRRKEFRLKSMKQRMVLLLLIGCILSSGCLGGQQRGEDAVFSGKGTVRIVPLEGGFFGIVSDDGHKYYPINLADEYKVQGLRVRFVAQLRGDVVTIQQWGTPIEIIEIEAIVGEESSRIPAPVIL
ncbi:MAG: hypothetical protein QCH35_01420 [Methanomicrobiaceae archaeon]|nr:hypothetical protein [Methanomicrobiaceae archaeon]